MKNYILILLIVFVFSSLSVNAIGNKSNSGTGKTEKIIIKNTKTEEDLCFEILTENVKNQYNIDLSFVEQSAEEGNMINLSTYKSFKNYTVVNDNQKYLKSSGLNLFSAKRNNIGTIKANGDYILSQFAGFGNRTNFTFPLKSSNSNYENGDIYPDFRQNIIYTHHLLDGSFVSCGFLKVTPQGSHDLFSIGQNDYKTNRFNGSGFELLKTSEKREGKNGVEEFLVGKVNVAADDYSDSDLFKINLLTVAYNNRSDYFNEYETFPKQVSAMTNTDTQKDGMSGVMINFFNKVKNETCLDLVHNNGNFPSKCGNKAQSLSFLQKIYSFFIPYSHASIQAVDNYENIMNDSRGIVMYDGLPLDLYEKIMKINDENLKNSLVAAILPNFEDMINYKKSNDILLTPYEKIFSQCNMKYSERMSNVIDFVEKIDLEKIDYNNFSYLDKKFGDCVIPYPDKENIGKVISNSFGELMNDKINILDGEKNLFEIKIDNKLNEINLLEEKLNKLGNDFEMKLSSGSLISDDELNLFNEKKEKLKNKHVVLKKELNELIEKSNMITTNLTEIETGSLVKNIEPKNNIITKGSNNNYIYYLLIIIFGLLGFIFIKLGLSKK